MIFETWSCLNIYFIEFFYKKKLSENDISLKNWSRHVFGTWQKKLKTGSQNLWSNRCFEDIFLKFDPKSMVKR